VGIKLILMMALGLLFCLEGPQSILGAELKTVEIKESRVPIMLKVPGKVEAEGSVEMVARVPGRVMRVFVEEGQRVEKGKDLIWIDDSELSAKGAGLKAQKEAQKKELEALEAELYYWEANLKRIKALYDEKAATKEELDRTEAKVKGLKAKREAVLNSIESLVHKEEELNSLLPYFRLKANEPGLVTQKLVKEGSHVNPGTPLMRLELPYQGYYFVADVGEEFLPKIKKGTPAVVILPRSNFFKPLEITTLVPKVDQQSRSFKVKVKLEGKVNSGEFGRLLIPIGERNAILIPKASVQQRGGLEGVMVAGEKGPEFRVIRTGEEWVLRENMLLPVDKGLLVEGDILVEVQSGLSLKEKILVQ